MKSPLYLLSLFLICGCAAGPLNIKTAAVDIPAPVTKAALPAPDPVKTQPVHFVIVNYGNPPEPVFCLTAKGYENLSKNAAETQRWAKEASEQLRYYRKTP